PGLSWAASSTSTRRRRPSSRPHTPAKNAGRSVAGRSRARRNRSSSVMARLRLGGRLPKKRKTERLSTTLFQKNPARRRRGADSATENDQKRPPALVGHGGFGIRFISLHRFIAFHFIAKAANTHPLQRNATETKPATPR